MTKSWGFVAMGLSIALAAMYQPSASAQDDTAVAQIAGHKITRTELQEREAGKLLQARYKYYQAEKDALTQLIEDELLEMQAAKENVTVEELLKRHVKVQLAEPTEDQLKFYYEGLGTEEPYEAVRSKILDTVHQLRFSKEKASYVAQLRSQWGVTVELRQPSAQVDVANAPAKGVQTAPIRLVEFADYQCPYCQKVHADLKKLQQEMPGEILFVYKDFPLPNHNLAEKAAEASRCAEQQGKFWEFHDTLFERHRLEVPDLKELARTLKLDGDRFDHCLDSGEEAAGIEKDVKEGERLGLSGTPSFFLNGHFLSGALTLAKLKDAVGEELAAQSARKQSASLMPVKDSSSQ
jgi:protein-disulfide isomerase